MHIFTFDLIILQIKSQITTHSKEDLSRSTVVPAVVLSRAIALAALVAAQQTRQAAQLTPDFYCRKALQFKIKHPSTALCKHPKFELYCLISMSYKITIKPGTLPAYTITCGFNRTL